MTENMDHICRDCLAEFIYVTKENRCPHCRSPRLSSHPELHNLSIAHIDCDAFYASIEKRDNPDLENQPVIIGGGQRGVVAAACYVARLYGVRSAMPMFKARQACPNAVIISPDMSKYRKVGEEIRTLMRELTPLVQPLSIDEAFLDLTIPANESGISAAIQLCALILRIEERIGISASIGLSYNKFLAKIASDMDKPCGFAVIGRAEAESFLSNQPVTVLWGVGKSLARKLRRDGIAKIGQVQHIEEPELVARYGSIGRQLYQFSRGIDLRKVKPNAPTKSISSETTFKKYIKNLSDLVEQIKPLCETVARGLKLKKLAGRGVTIKLKQSDFHLFTRACRLPSPTQQEYVILKAAEILLAKEVDGRTFRLVGVGVTDLTDKHEADPPDLFESSVSGKSNI